MLKIKDDIDLKELEKFGFRFMECDNNQYYTKQFIDNNGWLKAYWIDVKTRQIELEANDPFILLDDTIYDLIKADLVEKV